MQINTRLSHVHWDHRLGRYEVARRFWPRPWRPSL